MPRTERYFVTMPENIPTFTEGVRVAPNEGSFPLDATINVVTEDDYFLTFKIFPKGPAESEHLISLIEADPPLSDGVLYEKEVYVRDDVLIYDREFHLDSALPMLSQTAFKAARIFSNIEGIDVPVVEA